MPNYKKKITRLMTYKEFVEGIKDLNSKERAFLSVLFLTGCRISEALALESKDISFTHDTVYIQFFRLKGSTQTDPIPIPLIEPLEWLFSREGKLFKFSRMTGYRIVKRAFPNLYPHYFRMNRITQISDKLGDSVVYSFVGISAGAIDHYRGKVDIGRVAKELAKEVTD